MIYVPAGRGRNLSVAMADRLFIYGTLADPEVQQNVLGRVTESAPDILRGYRKSEIEIGGEKYPLIIPDETEKVKGLVIEVTKDELAKIDEYETNAYKRVQVSLESGMSAWAYVKR